jgi:hypothetical protein
MINNTFFNKLRTFKKRKQFLIATLISVAIFAVWQLFLQAKAGSFDAQTLGYIAALPITWWMGKEIFNNSNAAGGKVKAEDAEDFYSEESK